MKSCTPDHRRPYGEALLLFRAVEDVELIGWDGLMRILLDVVESILNNLYQLSGFTVNRLLSSGHCNRYKPKTVRTVQYV